MPPTTPPGETPKARYFDFRTSNPHSDGVG